MYFNLDSSLVYSEPPLLNAIPASFIVLVVSLTMLLTLFHSLTIWLIFTIAIVKPAIRSVIQLDAKKDLIEAPKLENEDFALSQPAESLFVAASCLTIPSILLFADLFNLL
jgi:hypothetical protein